MFSRGVALAGAVVAGGYAAIQFGRALLASRWPTVEGEIIDARMLRINEGQGANSLDTFVTYRYHVGGRHYTNDRLRFGVRPAPASFVPASDANPNLASGLAARYPHGKRVRVHYNPRRPEQSVLYLTPDVSVWVVLVAGLYLVYAAA